MGATVAGQRAQASDEWLRIGITWGYINHKRVVQLAKPELLTGKDLELFARCKKVGIVDERGIVICPPGPRSASSYIDNSIYDRFEFGDDQRLHALYTSFVDQISSSVDVCHVERESWTSAALADLIAPGGLIFSNTDYYFKAIMVTQSNEHRRCKSSRHGVTIEFYIDTENMFGTTSMTVSFAGHRRAAALVQVKSVKERPNGKLTLHCTPLALGVGFDR